MTSTCQEVASETHPFYRRRVRHIQAAEQTAHPTAVRAGGRVGHAPRARNADVIQLRLHRAETRFDIPQTLAIGELGERQAEILIPTGKP